MVILKYYQSNLDILVKTQTIVVYIGVLVIFEFSYDLSMV